MKNCIVKMVVKNRPRPNPEELLRSEQNQQFSSTPPTHASRSGQQKQLMGGQLKSLIGSFQKLLKEVHKLNKAHQIEPRDRKIVFQLPLLKQREGEIDELELKQWITNLCTEVFSAAFHYFEQGQMNYDQTKIYCSQNLICNIIRLNETYRLNAKSMKMIDQHINDGVSPYLLTKFPMTETQVVNKALQGEIKEIDNIQALQNDIFFYSHDSFGFEYRENGNYNDLIMKLMNYLMKKTDERQIKAAGSHKSSTFYEQFYQFIKKCFDKLQSREEMEGAVPTAKDQLAKRIDEQKYRIRVKSYTSWAIGRKISQNVSHFTESEIESMHITIKSPAILRILTKWCEELWTKFQKKNYFLDRTENVKCQKGSNVNTYFPWMKQIINDMIEEQKLEIQRYLQQVFANNYDQQAIHCFRSLQEDSFSHVEKFEKAAGIFTVNIVNNLHSYIILYLNRLIHGLLRVSKRVYDKQLIGRARWTSPPNLISFKIGDLMRCKIGSQEKQILKLFKDLSRLSEKQPKLFKIIRIKNRLKEGTNDILINFRFKDVFICEAQLGVNSDHSNFIKCSNKYNHFIYEVKRSIFGPITQLCSIWRSLDGRFKIYEKMALGKSSRIKEASQLKSLCQLQNRNHKMQRYNQPFVCSSCRLTYSHSNYIWAHNRCEACDYTQCCKCRISAQDELVLKQKLFKNSDLQKFVERVSYDSYIPKFGVCFLIESKHCSMQKFAKFTLKGKTGIYCRKGKDEIDLITDLNTKKQIDSFKDRYIIFKFTVPQAEKIVNITQAQAKNDFILPRLVKSIYKKQKQFISLIGEYLNDDKLAQTLQGSLDNRNLIRYLQLPDNQISNLDFICDNFVNLNKLVLSRNKITDIEPISKLLYITQLNVRDNLIQELPLSLFDRYTLESLNLRNNKFKSIPEEISKLTNLTKLQLNQLELKELPKSLETMTKITYLDLTKNNLGKVPQQLRKLINLQHLGLSANGIKQIPDWIGELTQLDQLQLNKNKLDQLPQSLVKLKKLSQLQLKGNRFEKLNFKCPESIAVIVLSDNDIAQIGQNFFVNCKNLVKIDLDKNKISTLPLNLGLACKKMKALNLKNNLLTDLPSIFEAFLPSLELIELNNNKFKKFPAKALKNCTELVELHMANNVEFDDDLPVAFLDNNFKIQKFDFSGTSLSRLPAQITLANTLKRLNFSGTSITSENLQVLNGLQFVQELDISKMKLKKLPHSLKTLHALRTLQANDNELSQFDEDFFVRLTHLRSISCSNNQIKNIPSSFKACRRIKNINFSNNLFTEFPKVFFELSKVQKINLSCNQIQKIDTKVPLAPTVVELNLSKNKICQISSAFFAGAQMLRKLNLSDNQLKKRLEQLRQCANLTDTDFTNNPIDFVPLEIAKQTFVAFLNMELENEEDFTVDRESLMNTYIG